MPYLEKWYHGMMPGIMIQEFPKVADDGTNNPAPWDTSDLNGNEDETDLVPHFEKFEDLGQNQSLTQAFTKTINYNFSTLPQFGGETSNPGAITLAGAYVDSIGFIPLGLMAAVDEDEDGVKDGMVGENGMVNDAPYAPQHSGVRGYPYIFLSIALDIDELIAGEGDMRLSAALKMFPDALPETVEFNEFPAFPVWSFTNEGAIQIGAATGASVARASADKWNIYMAADSTVSLPDLTEFGLEDRRPVERSDISQINTISLSVDYDTLMSFNNTNLDNLNVLTKGFVLILP
jgi:hypothetical protein